MPPTRQLVLIPSYNTGPLVLRTVREARAAWSPVWVVVDGSTDGTGARLQALARDDPGLRVMLLPVNRGKGAAVLAGLRAALGEGFTHALVMDADGQHPAGCIPAMMAASRAAPAAMILGDPLFGPEAPLIRLRGRRISNRLAQLETLGGGIGDVLFGFRVYPIAPLVGIMRQSRWMRRFDFDPEAAVRLSWQGVPAVNRPVPCRYLRPEEGGVSHFHYLRDNLRLAWMHARLVLGMLGRSPRLLKRRAAPPAAATPR
ncbi:MAG: glycosyltransferase family 2 protein [Paracraurococcus sp.]|jgi:glycosyltransferase involved in cell wall biosynthesis